MKETSLSVEEIAMRAGFGTATSFRQHFRVATGLPPATYRSRFHRDAEARAR
ncbi:helix-turn-helix domain-containing protein [Pseudoxanthomonas sp. UC19_8]|uniref:helix-turn-helix domain-containing protein n=1 Tax=Pseudoxanthomonas sp. UC19_8 TaxID=3350175 RepID=UPI0036D2E716